MNFLRRQSLLVWLLAISTFTLLVLRESSSSRSVILDGALFISIIALAAYALFISNKLIDQSSRLEILRGKPKAETEILRKFFEEAPIGVFAKDSNGRFVYANRRFNEIFGVKDSDRLIGATGSSIFPPEILEYDIQSDKELKEKQHALMQEVYLPNRDVNEELMLFEKHFVNTDSGEVILGTLIELKLLSETHSKIRKLLVAVEESPISIVITNVDGKVEYANKQFEILTGYKRTEVIGNYPSILKSGHHDKEFYRNLWSTIKAGRKWRGETLNRKKDGTEFWEDSTIVPIKNNDGNIINFVAVKENVTAIKEAIREANEAKITAEIAVKSRTQFLNNLASEISIPVSLISSYAKILHNDKSLGNKQTAITEDLLQKCHDFQSMMDNITELSKIYLDSVELNPVEFDIQKMAQEILSFFRAKAADKNIKLTMESDLSFGNAVRQDKKKIKLIISNLIENAIDHTHEGKISLSLFSVVDIENNSRIEEYIPGKVAIEILDTGEGIDEDDQERIFKSFENFTSKDINSQTTGLGLAIGQKYAQLMGGEIKLVWSKAKKGSLFKIDIPVGFPTASIRFDSSGNPVKNELNSLVNKEIIIHEPQPFDPTVLPGKFAERLYHAGLTGNMNELSKIIDEINLENPEVESHLRKWLKDLKITNFVNAFDPKKLAERR